MKVVTIPATPTIPPRSNKRSSVDPKGLTVGELMSAKAPAARTIRSSVGPTPRGIGGPADTHFEPGAVFAHTNGNFAAPGKVPRFYSELEAGGIPADQAVFR